MLTTAFRWPFFVPSRNNADRIRCALYHRLITKTVDNVTPFLVNAKKEIHCEKIFDHYVSLLSVIPGCILPSFK